MSEGISHSGQRLDRLVDQIIFAAWDQSVTRRSGLDRMLFGSTLRFTAKTRKLQSQQPPWHRDCYIQMQVNGWSHVC